MEKHKKSKWFKRVVWYIYKLSMIAICGVTFFLIYANKNNLEVTLNTSTTILLATIGFLFAFAGINIYSIFNTNIEEEKDRLRDLHSQYEKEMSFERRQGEYTRKLLLYYQICQIISDSQIFNRQAYELILDLKYYIKVFKEYLPLLYKERNDLYSSSRGDFLEVSNGIKSQLISFKKQIQSDKSSFFNLVTKGDKNNYLKELDSVLLELESLEYYDFTGTQKRQPEQDKLTITKSIKKTWFSIKKIFWFIRCFE